MSEKQMFMKPVSPYALDDSELDRLRRQLADAERVAARASSYTDRTRAEQDVKILTRELNGAELQRRLDVAHQKLNLNRPANVEHRVAVANAVAAGRCLEPVPYFAQQASKTVWQDSKTVEDVPAQQTPQQELDALITERDRLTAILNDPATSPAAGTSALIQLAAVLVKIEQRRVSTTTSTGMHAANSRRLGFEDAGALLKIAFRLGVLKTA